MGSLLQFVFLLKIIVLYLVLLGGSINLLLLLFSSGNGSWVFITLNLRWWHKQERSYPAGCLFKVSAPYEFSLILLLLPWAGSFTVLPAGVALNELVISLASPDTIAISYISPSPSPPPHDNRWESIIIDDNRWESKNTKFLFIDKVIDFRYQSIYCYRSLLSTAIDCYRFSSRPGKISVMYRWHLKVKDLTPW